MKATKILGLSLATVVGLAIATPAQAGMLKAVQVSPIDSTQSNTNPTSHRFTMTPSDATPIKKIILQYCTRASTDTAGTVNLCDAPDGFSAGTPTLGNTGNHTDNWGDWTEGMYSSGTWTPTAVTNTLTLTNSATYTPTGGNPFQFAFGGITNAKIVANQAQNQCLPNITGDAANSSSATCFIRISTIAGDGTTVIDSATITYTVVASVKISATVDPTFNFTVQGVNSNTTITPGLVTTVTSAYNTLPFGNLQADTAKYAAHKLFVKTNTQSGYTVTVSMTTAIGGQYGGNKIDPFTGVWATGGIPWANPTSTTPNTNTGFFGAHIEDTVTDGGPSSNTAGAQHFAGITTGTAYPVKDSNSSDAGTTGHYVTYAIAADINQPADTYTGYLVYNAIPKY